MKCHFSIFAEPQAIVLVLKVCSKVDKHKWSIIGKILTKQMS